MKSSGVHLVYVLCSLPSLTFSAWRGGRPRWHGETVVAAGSVTLSTCAATFEIS